MTEEEKLLIYETEKRQIRSTSKTEAEYEMRIKKLVEELGI